MNECIRAEILRLAATPALRRFLLAGFGIGLLLTGGLILLGPDRMNPPMPGAETPDGIRGLLGVLVLTAPVPVMLGARMLTGEQQHRTIVPTVLAQPHRHRVVLAKLAVSLAAGLAYGLLLAAGTVSGVLAGTAIVGVTPGIGLAELTAGALRIGAAMALYSVIGVGLGALIPRPQVCLAVVVGYFYLLESLLSGVPGVQRGYPWLPGGAASAITGQSFVLEAINRTTSGGGAHLLPAWAGVLVLLGYALAASTLALATTLRRDIH